MTWKRQEESGNHFFHPSLFGAVSLSKTGASTDQQNRRRTMQCNEQTLLQYAKET